MHFVTSLSNLSSLESFTLIIIGLLGLIGILLLSNITLLKIVISLGFAEGIFGLMGLRIFQYYKVLFISLMILLYIKSSKTHKYINGIKYKQINLYFILFSMMFLLSSIINRSNIIDIIMVYSSYFFFYIMVIYLLNNRIKNDSIIFITKLIYFQIFFSVIKLIVIGRNEALVGTLAYTSGGVATIFPIISLIFLYKFKFHELSNKTRIMLVLGLLLIGIASNKRAIWIFFPTILMAINFTRLKIGSNYHKIFGVILSGIVIIYLGIRINPSLNPSKIIWGEFDLSYTWEYILNYTFDTEALEKTGVATGRLTGNLVMMNYVKDIFNINLWFGYGPGTLRGIGRTSYFVQELGYETMKSITGISRMIIVFGLLGFFFFLQFIRKIVLSLKVLNKQYLVPVAILLVFDLFFYQGLLLFNRACMIIFIFLVIPFRLELKRNK